MRLLSLCILLLLIGCGPKSDLIISEEAAADLFLDITLSDQLVNLHNPEDRDSIRNLLTQSLLKIHNISQGELDANLYLYMSDFERFGSLTDRMMVKYDSLEKVLKETSDEVKNK